GELAVHAAEILARADGADLVEGGTGELDHRAQEQKVVVLGIPATQEDSFVEVAANSGWKQVGHAVAVLPENPNDLDERAALYIPRPRPSPPVSPVMVIIAPPCPSCDLLYASDGGPWDAWTHTHESRTHSRQAASPQGQGSPAGAVQHLGPGDGLHPRC